MIARFDRRATCTAPAHVARAKAPAREQAERDLFVMGEQAPDLRAKGWASGR